MGAGGAVSACQQASELLAQMVVYAVRFMRTMAILGGRRSVRLSQKVSKKGGVGGPVALASGYENTYPLPNRPE